MDNHTSISTMPEPGFKENDDNDDPTTITCHFVGRALGNPRSSFAAET